MAVATKVLPNSPTCYKKNTTKHVKGKTQKLYIYDGTILVSNYENNLWITIQDIITYFTIIMFVAMVGIFLYKQKASKP